MKKSEITKKRILRAAAALLAEHGYHATTHQMICTRADVNIAAINYHFGNKEQLYLKVWEYLVAIGMQNYRDCIDDEDPPEEQLHAFIRWRVKAVTKSGMGSYLSRIMRREVAKPSPVCEILQERYLTEKRKWFFGLIREIVGHDLDARAISMAAFCIHSPLVHLVEMKSIISASQDESIKEQLKEFWKDPEELAENIYIFAIAGLRKLRENNGK